MPLHHTQRRARFRKRRPLRGARHAREHSEVQDPARGLAPDIAFHVINDELMLDGNARQNLATFCQTWFDDEIHKLMDLSIDKNMIDKDDIRQRRKSKTAACTSSPIFGMRRRQATRSAARRRARASGDARGLALKWKWRERQAKLGKPPTVRTS